MRLLKPHFALWCVSLLLAACGGSSGGGSSQPTANAGINQSVAAGNIVQLDGSGSTASGKHTIDYQWTLVAAPELSKASLSSSVLVNPTFATDLPGNYIAELRVTSNNRISEASRVTITATTAHPVAVTETTLNRLVNGWIQLDGSNSLPPTGGNAALLTYAWTLSGPTGTALALDNHASATPGFSPTVEGIYRATLKVAYENQVSDSVLVLINVSKANSVPVAQAGGPYTVVLGETVTLDGSKSSDADGDSLNYRWVLPNNTHPQPTANDNKPRASSVQLPTTDSATIDFTPDAVGTYRINLQVFDGTALSAASVALVTVTKPEGQANHRPVAVIADHAPIGLGGSVGETEVSAFGGAGFYSNSYDADGDTLTYKWEWVSVPEAFKNEASYAPSYLATRTTVLTFNPVTGAYPSFTPIEGFYTARLTVSDGTLESEPVEQTLHIRTGANTRPTPVAKADLTAVLIGTQAWFDGSDSSDPQDGTLGLKYQWSWVYIPPGSSAVLNTPTAARTSFTPDVPGPYIAELIVTDNDGASSKPGHGSYVPVTATVNAKLSNNAPFARFTNAHPSNGFEAEQGIYSGMTFDDALGIYTYQLGSIYERCGSNSAWAMGYSCVDNFSVYSAGYDVDGDRIFYDIQLQQPAGSNYQPSYTGEYINAQSGRVDIGRLYNSATPAELGITVPGDYVFILQASDGSSLSDPQTLTVRVLDYLPDYKTLSVGYHYNSAVVSADGSELVHSHFLPFNINDEARDLSAFAAQDGVMQYFKLTARGQDYHIENAKVKVTQLVDGQYVEDFDGSANLAPAFHNLPEIVRDGETVVFGLWLPKLPGEVLPVGVSTGERYFFEWYFDSSDVTPADRDNSFRVKVMVRVATPK